MGNRSGGIMRHSHYLLLCFLLPAAVAFAQVPDSLYRTLPEAAVRIDVRRLQLRSLSAENVIDTSLTGKVPPGSVLPALNSAPGVRMEERSPGSYRLSVRGSLLRSPFGVRNVRVYLGELPFTDAGGNTYLNSLDLSDAASIRILKGPESSLFGANTGGVLLINPAPAFRDTLLAGMTFSGGSFGLFHEHTTFAMRKSKSEFSFAHAYLRSDGYRDNSAIGKHYLQLSEKLYYHPRSMLTMLLLFSDLFYQTPGGLTLQQLEASPSAARPATATLPGAVQQKASVSNRTVFGGITHELRLPRSIRHVLALSGGHTDFANPFITNYEIRSESTASVRTWLEHGKSFGRFMLRSSLGGEWQETWARIRNYGNDGGNKGVLNASDQVYARQAFLFARVQGDLFGRLLAEASLSRNFSGYRYRNGFPGYESSFSRKTFQPQWMPGISASFLLSGNFSWRASVRGGYSAPTIAEVRASDNVVNTALEAEKGISYETGLRYNAWKERVRIDASVFYFRLGQAIVRRLNEDGTEYFINAGGTSQPGIEAQVTCDPIRPRASGFFRSLSVTGSGTYSRFRFRDYRTGDTDYSGNPLTGVPRFTATGILSAGLPRGISLFTQYYYASSIPLNDAGSVYARGYHLLQARAEWATRAGRAGLTFFFGGDNLLNQRYSLGHDLNAAGGRYYNAAAPRNWYGGLKIVPRL